MDLLALEQQRQALEINIQNLRRSLRHWQTWEAEYEAVKEEIGEFHGALTPNDFSRIAEACGGDLVNEKGLRELALSPTGSVRPTEQILSLVERRQEYVRRNIETVQTRFFQAEAKQEELAFAAANHGATIDDESALPLTEILEELDDDDNVLSSRLSQPEEHTAKVISALRKAGLDDDDDLKGTWRPKLNPEDLKPAIVNSSPPITPTFNKRLKSDSPVPNASANCRQDEQERPSARKKSVSFTADTKAPPERTRQESEDGRKSVSFAEKVAVMPAAPPADTRSVSFSARVEEIPTRSAEQESPKINSTATTNKVMLQADPTRQKELREAFKPGDRVIQLNDNDEVESIQVVMPEDESPEDAATRRELLEYHLNEVGNIVAQLDLEEENAETGTEEDDDASSYYTSSEHWDDEDTPYTTGLSESEDEEDEHGRSTRHMISPEYRKQMLELERRLIGNLGPRPTDEALEQLDPQLNPADVKRLVVREKRSSISSASSESSDKKTATKKRVSFAESVDLAPTETTPVKAQKHRPGENAAPVSVPVMERSTATSHSVPQASEIAKTKCSKPSRLASSLKLHSAPPFIASSPDGTAVDTTHEDRPTGPAGKPLADILTERVLKQKSTTVPTNADTDTVADQRQLANEFYRHRNNIIKEQGGFQGTSDLDDMYGELMEERDGKIKKVSRFKAARIRS